LSENNERRTSKIDEIMGKSPEDVAAQNLQKRKEERVQKQKITAWMRRNAIIYTSVVALLIVIAVAAAVLIKNAVKKERSANPETAGVLVIDGEIISEEEFVFFCSTVIEADTFGQMALSDGNTARLCENVKTVAVKNAEEFICKVHEAEKAGVALGDKETADIAESIELASKGYKSKDEYCAKFYGLNYADYFNFRKQVELVRKYIGILSDSADIGADNQKKVYSENVDAFASLEVKMIYMDIRGCDETEISHKKTNAETLLHYVNDGQDIGQLSEAHSDENGLFNVAEHGGNDTVTLDSRLSNEYLPIYKAASAMQVGETKVIETDNEICVIYCAKKSDFEDSLNSEELVNYIKTEYVSDYFESVMTTGKYSAVVNNDLYAAVDISDYVEMMKNVYTQEAK